MINNNIEGKEFSNLSQFYLERIKITHRKYEDLQFLKSILPKDYHKYCDDLHINKTLFF